MSVGLDLSSSDAKIARAREHLAVLAREVPDDLAEDAPYALRFSEVDPRTGWCEVFLVPRDAGKPRFSTVMGDVIHNLRCALDYIVTSLVDASWAMLTTRHQFPIYAEEAAYIKSVGTAAGPAKGGPLTDIIHGLGLMEQVQPFRRDIRPATRSPLARPPLRQRRQAPGTGNPVSCPRRRDSDPLQRHPRRGKSGG